MPTDQRPNILLIMTDQQRGDCLGIEGHPVLQTPNMDNLAAQGVRFSRAYSTCPSCIAARRSLMSGQHPQRTGMVGYQDGVEWEKPPPLLPQLLRDAGYQTVLVGRSMHMSPPRKRYGFEQLIHANGPRYNGAESEYDKWMRQNAPDTAGGYYGTGVMHNDWVGRPWHLDEATHQTNWTVSRALDWLDQRDPTAPFFMVMSFIAPHPPLVPPAFYFDRYMRLPLVEPIMGDWAKPPLHDGVGDDVAAGEVNLTGEALRCARAAYYGLINHVDDQIRRVLNPVTGIDRMTGSNTVVMLTSDHGEMLGDHYRWRKTVPFEPSARIPLAFRAPQRFGLQKRAVVDQLACLEDVMPTLLDFAGVPTPDSVDGRSLLPLMRGEQPAWRERLHIEHAPQHQTLVDQQYKYIWWTGDGREQLFDLKSDPQELHDLAARPESSGRLEQYRSLLVEKLRGRPEGFVNDAGQLQAGRPYVAALPHARASREAR